MAKNFTIKFEDERKNFKQGIRVFLGWRGYAQERRYLKT